MPEDHLVATLKKSDIIRVKQADLKGGVQDVNVTNIAIDIKATQILVQLSCLEIIAIK
mgnify:CR=1 FL=1